MKNAAALFNYFESQKSATLDDTFDNEIIARIRDQKKPVVRSLHGSYKRYLNIAAVLIGVIIASVIFRMEFLEGDKPKMLLVEDTFKTPEEAYEETKKAFCFTAPR